MERRKEIDKLLSQVSEKGLKDYIIIRAFDKPEIPGKRLTTEEAELLKDEVSISFFTSMIRFSDESDEGKIPILIHRKDFKITYLYTGGDADKQTEI